MPDKDNNILKYNPGEKCMKVPFDIYVDLKCLLENISFCHQQLKQINILLLVVNSLHTVHLTIQNL